MKMWLFTSWIFGTNTTRIFNIKTNFLTATNKNKITILLNNSTRPTEIIFNGLRRATNTPGRSGGTGGPQTT
jgi:hypothetical protein